MKFLLTILLFCATSAPAQKRDTISAILIYSDTVQKSMTGFYFIDEKGIYNYLTSTKKPIKSTYKVAYPAAPRVDGSDTLIAGPGITIDSVSPKKFSIRSNR